MKKTRLLIATLVCAVMLMGVGYAWWTDSIAIGSTVETGKMDVHWQNACGFPIVGGNCYTDYGKTTVTPDLITVWFKDLYPGAKVWVDAIAINEGTLSAKLKEASIEVDVDEELASDLEAMAKFYRTNAKGYYIPFSYGETKFDTLDKLAENLNKHPRFKGMILKPNERLHFGVPSQDIIEDDEVIESSEEESCIIIRLNCDAGNDTQSKSGSFNLTLDWDQYSPCVPCPPCPKSDEGV